jgi:hypothetical protein
VNTVTVKHSSCAVCCRTQSALLFAITRFDVIAVILMKTDVLCEMMPWRGRKFKGGGRIADRVQSGKELMDF